MAKKKNPFRSKSLKAAYDRYIGDDPEQQAAFEEELANAEVAQKIYDLRTKAGLSQRAAGQTRRDNGVRHLPTGELGLPGALALDAPPHRGGARQARGDSLRSSQTQARAGLRCGPQAQWAIFIAMSFLAIATSAPRSLRCGPHGLRGTSGDCRIGFTT